MKELAEILNGIATEGQGQGDDTSFEFEITAKKKENKHISLGQLFDELIDEYPRHHLDTDNPYIRDIFGDDMKKRVFSETTCRIRLVTKDYLNVSDENGERFILLPERDGLRFETGSEHFFITEQYKDYSFLVADCTASDYERLLPSLDGADAEERCDLVNQVRKDPDGFSLWAKLGGVVRPRIGSESSRRSIIENRADQLLKRIPRDRDDLYDTLWAARKQYIRSPGSSEYNREKDLQIKMNLISMMLSSNSGSEPLTAEWLAGRLEGAKVSARDVADRREQDWFPNILIAGRNYKEAIERISSTQNSFIDISLGGVQGNDYLFGDPMCYTGTNIGELASRLSDSGEYPAFIVFSDIDLMGTTVRASNPIYGLAALLRKHTFTDFFMRTLTVDVKRTHFVCQVPRIEDCPMLLLQEMDIVVEL